MKVLIISRATLYSAPGGDTIQILETANHLKMLNVEVDIKLTSDQIDYAQYSLVHFFNIIRPADILVHSRKLSCKFVISTIFVDYSEFEKKARPGLLKYVSRVVSTDIIEYGKTIARSILNNERIQSVDYLLRGQKNSIRFLIKKCALLLPNSMSEYNRLRKKFGIEKDFIVVPNAINRNMFNKLPDPGLKIGVLCAGQFEPRKNQLNLIKAINQTNYKLTLIGKCSPNNSRYYEQCVMEAEQNPNITFINYLEQDKLVQYYYKAKVHVLASWFETTGLSSLEAAAAGCNLVITKKGDTEEYFRDEAFYCSPDSVASLKDAIEKAYQSVGDNGLRNRILADYTWEAAAEKTLMGYKKVLNEE